MDCKEKVNRSAVALLKTLQRPTDALVERNRTCKGQCENCPNKQKNQ